jgi:hypothetical protein
VAESRPTFEEPDDQTRAWIRRNVEATVSFLRACGEQGKVTAETLDEVWVAQRTNLSRREPTGRLWG